LKTSESKTASQSRHSKPESPSSQPFFSQEQESRQPFFGRESESEAPFFDTLGIQPKLTIGQPGDKYEREADATADRVVRKLEVRSRNSEVGRTPSRVTNHESRITGQESPSTQQSLQAKSSVGNHLSLLTSHSYLARKCADCEAEEEQQLSPKEKPGIQRKPIFESGNELTEESIQPKRFSNAPTLQLQGEAPPEEQAEELQEELQRQPLGATNGDPSEEETLQTKCADCEASIQLQTTPNNATAVPSLESRLNSSKGSGKPLPKDTRSSMESAMGVDFSGVRVHTGGDSVQMNQELGARAFTHGSDIHFNTGQYDTDSTEGKRLLAHELVHTVQQGGAGKTGAVRPKIQLLPNWVSDAADWVSDTASDAADSVVEGAQWVGGKIVDGTEWVGDQVSSGVEWVFDQIRDLVNSGYNWLNGKWEEIKSFGRSSFDDIKNGFRNLISLVTNPLSLLISALTQMNPDIIGAIWNGLVTGANVLKTGIDLVVDGVLSVGQGIWSTVSSFINSSFNRVEGLLNGSVFGLLPNWMQREARSLFNSFRSLWNRVSLFWTNLWQRLTMTIQQILTAIQSFIEKILNFDIQSVITKLTKYVPFIEMLQQAVEKPDTVTDPLVGELAKPLNQQMPAKSIEIANERASEQAGQATSKTNNAKSVIQLSPQPGIIQRSSRGTASLMEVSSGMERHIREKWAQVDVWQMIKDMFWTLLWPWPTVGHEIAAFFTEDIPRIADQFFTPRSPLQEPLGSLHDIWTNILYIGDFTLALWRRINNIAMALMGWITLVLVILGAVGGTLAGGVIGGILSAAASLGVATPAGAAAGAGAGGVTGAGAGLAAALALGEIFLFSFVGALGASILKALLDLFTGNQTDDEKEEDYAQIADSVIGIGVTVILVFVGWLASKLAMAIINFIKRIKAPRPDEPVEVIPAEEGGVRDSEEGRARKSEEESVFDPLVGIRTALRERIAQLRERILEIQQRVRELPERSEGRRTLEEGLTEVNDRLNRNERDIGDATSAEELGLIEQDLNVVENNTIPKIEARILEEVRLAEIEKVYEQLGDEPRHIDMAANEAANPGAHGIESHGPQIPLERSLDASGNPTGVRTIEGRIHGDLPWEGSTSFSARWSSMDIMNQTVNRYIRANWEQIRSDLALKGEHSGLHNARSPIGEGYYNTNYGQGGPRVSTGPVPVGISTIVIRIIAGDPPSYYVHTAFPNLSGSVH